MYRPLFVSIVSCLLITLWVYAALSKLLDFDKYVWELKNQVFNVEISVALIYLIPLAEFIAVFLLSIKRTRHHGLLFSSFLLLIFTGYIVSLLVGAFNRIPCACGGILAKMSWESHLAFNIVFLILTLSALFLNMKERRFYEMK